MICSRPDCKKAGIDQPPENFYRHERYCKACKKKIAGDWYKKNRKEVLEGRKWVPDDDPETDLHPDSMGEANWCRLTR